MSDTRKPWEIPIQYNDDRWPDQQLANEPMPAGDGNGRRHGADGDLDDDRDSRDVDEIISRPARGREEKTYECNDTTPINYGHGPEDVEFGVNESDENFERADTDDEGFPDDFGEE